MIRRVTTALTMSVVALMALHPVSANAARDGSVHTTIVTPSTAPPGGYWTLYAPSLATELRPNSIPGDPGGSCPRGTTNYPLARWSCLEVTPDAQHHGVWIRNGLSGKFGYLHAFLDHNVDLHTIVDVVARSKYGLKQPSGRFLYGAQYHVNGHSVIFLNVYEQRTPGDVSPDSNELGVVTGYCTSTFNASEPSTKCPEWVNETL